MLLRVAGVGAGRHVRACSVVLSLALGSGCVDDLSRLGAGRASISAGPDAVATDAHLADPLHPDSSNADAGLLTLATDAAAPSHGPELLPNPSFEAGHAGWVGFGSSRILDVVGGHTGGRAILSTNREYTWEGPSYDIQALVTAATPYELSAWVRNELDTHNIMLTLKTRCGDDTTYTRLATRAVANEWLELDASFLAPDCAALGELSAYIEGPPENKNILVDDVSLRSVSLLSDADGL